MSNTTVCEILEYENALRDGGVPENQVRAQTKALAQIIESNLATKHDISLVQKDIQKFKIIENLLINEIKLPLKNKDHALTGNYINFRECHIENDWLLIYRINENHVMFECTGTHSDLF
jgi:mRNA interferase YafQ